MSLVYDEGIDEELAHSLCPRTLLRIVPFLVSFPKLEMAFVGGGYAYDRDENMDLRKNEYDTYGCIQPDNHVTLFRSLIEQFCMEFKSKGLPPKLDLRGVLPERFYVPRFDCRDYHEEADYEDGTKACLLCSNICAHFPPHAVIDASPSLYFPF